MEFTQEDDDLLSYFLSAEVAAEQAEALIASMAKSEQGVFAGLSAPTSSSSSASGGGSSSATAGGAGNNKTPEQFSFGQQVLPSAQDQVFGLKSKNSDQPKQQSTNALKKQASQDDSGDGNGSAGSSGVSTPMDSDEKRQRRLARNRESARQSRRRKKQYLELLEEKVSQLTESIDLTRATHLEKADEALVKVRSELLSSLVADASNTADDAARAEKLRKGMKVIQERFGPNSAERIALKDYNFRQLDNLLLPPYCRLLLWLSIQDDAFFDENANANAKAGQEGAEKRKPVQQVRKEALWSTLVNELALTYEQDEKLKALYKSGESKVTKSERRRIALAATYLSKLRKSLEARAAAVQRHSDAIFSILTPEQSVKYLQWVDANQERLKGHLRQSDVVANTGASETVLSILKKNDRELSVEDVTVLLREL